MTIEVTGCHDCPFRKENYWCPKTVMQVYRYAVNGNIHPSCPLKQETITIKLKEDVDTNIKRH